MAGLSISELKKRPGRIETFATKLKQGSAFAMTPSGSIIAENVIINDKVYDKNDSVKIIKAIEMAKKIVLVSKKGDSVPIGKLLKSGEFGGSGGSPGEAAKGNRGDMAEAIFAAAITARFMTKNQNVTAIHIHALLDKLRTDKMQQTHEYEGLNMNPKIIDSVTLKVGLAIPNLVALQDRTIRASLSDVVASAIKYANAPIVVKWAKMLYENNQRNSIEIIADGIGDQTGTKVDVRLRVDNIATNLNVSLKAGDVKQFGQVGGSGFDKQEYLWKTLAGLNVSAIEAEYVKLLSQKKALKSIETSYGEAADKFNAEIKTSEKNVYKKLALGIKFFATMNEENVTLVQLNKEEAKIYKFDLLFNALQANETKITAKLNTSKTYPEVNFEDDTGEILLTVRAKTENKPSGEQYIRNYVEKGPLMGKLVATYA